MYCRKWRLIRLRSLGFSENKQYPRRIFYTHTLISTLPWLSRQCTFHGQTPQCGFHFAELYNIAMESGMLMDKGRIHGAFYQYDFCTVCHRESYDWVEKFITRWIGNVITTDLQGQHPPAPCPQLFLPITICRCHSIHSSNLICNQDQN